MPLFNDIDVALVVERFNLDGLRRELDRTRSKLAVALYLDEDAEGAFLEEYLEVVQVAIKVARGVLPKMKLAPGQVSLADIKSHNDIVEVAERYTQLKKSGNRLKGKCPLHEDWEPSFFVSPDKQNWHCFQCNEGGDVFDLVQKIEHCDIKQAAAILRG